MSYACDVFVSQLSLTIKEFPGTYLANELHVTILDTVVHHFDVVAGTLITDPLAAGLAVALGSDALEDVLDIGPRLLVATGHHRGAVTSALLAAGHAGTDKADALASEVLCSPVRVGEMGVAAVDDDIASTQKGKESLNPVVNGLAGLDEEHDTAGALQLGDELLDRVGSDDRLALGLVVEESVDLGHGAVESADGVAVVGHVHDNVLAPVYCQLSAGRGRSSARAVEG